MQIIEIKELMRKFCSKEEGKYHQIELIIKHLKQICLKAT